MSKNRKITNTANADSKPKRRWLNIGPGIILALAISAFIGSQWIKTEVAARRQPSAPPIVERQVISSSFDEKAGPTPEVKFILDHKSKLGLSAAQVADLKKLQSDWQRIYGPKIAEANRAAVRTNDYMADAKGNRRTPVAQIQNAAAPLIALSREISDGRRSYWVQAGKFLTPEQRKALGKEREADWAAKTAATAKSRQ